MELLKREDSKGMPVNEKPDPMTKKPAVLEQAFDRTLVKPLLQQALFPKSSSSFVLEDCEPSKAFPLGENTWRMQYRLAIKNIATGQVSTILANALIFPSLAEGERYMKSKLHPLVGQVGQRPELEPFGRLVSLVKPLKMVVSVFPIDGALPTVVGATDPQQMLAIFNQTLPEARAKNIQINGFHFELAHYGRHERCVLRYTLHGEHTGTRAPFSLTVYGKINTEDRGGVTDELIQSLHEKLRSQNLPFSFQVPYSYGYIEDRKLLLMEAIPGQPMVKHLIKGGPGYEKDGLTLKEAIQVSARIAAALHNAGINIGDRVSLADRAEQVRQEVGSIQREQPELAARVFAYLDEIVAFAEGYPTLPPVLNHGDYTYTQLIFDGTKAGLVDFDTICQAEPALDLGQYIAYQRLAFLKEQDPEKPFTTQEVEASCENFFEAYFEIFPHQEADEALIRTRTLFYELVSLVRLMVHSAEKQKGSRFLLARQLVEERMQCLKHLELPETN